MITVEGVSKAFGTKMVLQELNLEVKDKEILTLLGPNGSGKTTLLNILSGLTKPDSGSIYIDGVLVNGKKGNKIICLTPSERKVGYVFQTISLFPHMRIQDNVAYGLKAMRLSAQEVKKRTQSLMEFVGLSEYAKSYPHQLSGGQRQRAALARSLATEPKVLLLDEPVSAVDPQLRESFRLELKNYLQTLKITAVYVTHNLSEAFIMSDRIAVMGHGSIQQIGTGPELFDKPQSTYTAKFLGINTFKAYVTKASDTFMEIQSSDKTLYAPLAPQLVGKDVICTLKTENVHLHKKAPPKTKVDNALEGTITEMVQMRSNAQVTIDVGFILNARVPLFEIKRLGVSSGDQVYVCFDADSLNVFTEGTG
jgi:ABC-type Fe3+/spermidine/putrescine transport system ATPase subunit